VEPSNIILRRRWFRGDVLACSPILHAVGRRHPKANLFFETDVGGVLANNPLLAEPAQAVINHHNDTQVWDLGNFAGTLGWHLVDIMAANQFKPGEVEHRLEMFPTAKHMQWADSVTPFDGAIVLAPGPGAWVGRNWPSDRWNNLIEKLLPDYSVIVVGTLDRYKYHLLPQVYDLRGKTDEMQLAALMAHAKLVVGIDGFPLHVAGAMRTPRIGLFGITQPELILCDAPWRAVYSDPAHPMTGARHKVRFMSEARCRTDNNPMLTITVDQVLGTIREALR
jgi:hypothetical protein